MKLILQQAGRMALAGIGIGLAISYAAGRALSAALQVPAFDAVWLSAVAVTLLAVTLLAAGLPARRAAHIDPMRALQQD